MMLLFLSLTTFSETGADRVLSLEATLWWVI